MAHIVEAVDSGHFQDSVFAWKWFAEQGLLSDGGARWLVELAHALGNILDAAPLVAKYPAVRKQVEAYAASLAADPKLGQYTSLAESNGFPFRSLRDRDVRSLLESITPEHLSTTP